MNNKLSKVTSILIAMSIALLFAPAHAQDDKWGFNLGVFLTDYDSDTSLDASNGDSGFDTSLEDDLGLEDSDEIFRGDAYYKFNDRHRLDFSIFDLSRSGSGILQTDIQWGDEIFTINSLIDTDLDLEIYKLAYTYSFVNRENGWLGFSGGLYVADLGLSLIEITTGAQSENNQITVPLPVVGFRGEYNLSQNWTFRGSTEFFFIEFDEFKGSLFDLYVGLDYQLFENVALGIGANWVNIDVESDKNAFTGELDWNYSGGLAYLRFDF